MKAESFTLDDAIALARTAHAGQLDKAGRPYIGHPLRVMARVATVEEQITAVLHDVLEDTDVTAEGLRAANCPEPVIAAVVALTKQPDEPLTESMARAAADPIARVVKRADIADNNDPARLRLLDPEVADRLRAKYAQSIELLDRYGTPRVRES